MNGEAKPVTTVKNVPFLIFLFALFAPFVFRWCRLPIPCSLKALSTEIREGTTTIRASIYHIIHRGLISFRAQQRVDKPSGCEVCDTDLSETPIRVLTAISSRVVRKKQFRHGDEVGEDDELEDGDAEEHGV